MCVCLHECVSACVHVCVRASVHVCARAREQARCISRNSSGRRRAERAGAEQSQHDCRPPAPLARSEMGEGDSGDDDDDDESNDCTVCDIYFFLSSSPIDNCGDVNGICNNRDFIAKPMAGDHYNKRVDKSS